MTVALRTPIAGLSLIAALLGCSSPSTDPPPPPKAAAALVVVPVPPPVQAPSIERAAPEVAYKMEASALHDAPRVDRRASIGGIAALHAPVAAQVQISPQPMPAQEADTARYPNFQDQAWQQVAQTPVSTFSASVDTGSYANLRRFLSRGQLPPRDAVRVEEMVNYFGYEDAPPDAKSAMPFAVNLQLAAAPWNPAHGLLRIGLKAQDPAKTTLPPANLVFLVDVSGSMSPSDRLPLVRSALALLTQQLRAQDRVAIVSYANGTRVVLPATPGDRKPEIQAAIASLESGGGTNGEAGIRLAYAQAHAGYVKGGINRVLLATDGDLNIGVTEPNALKDLVDRERKAGISLSTLGVGDSNFNEVLMKRLANSGDGSYHYLDSLQEAHKVLVNEFSSTLGVIARDLKLQIEFNPDEAGEYRLIGYEMNALRREDFSNDQVDAGDIGAGHSVTALYEWIPRAAKGSADPLRYGQAAQPATGAHKGELAWLKLRFKRAGREDSELHQLAVRLPDRLPAIEQAASDLRWSAAVAAWGQWLRGSTQIGGFGAQQALALAREAKGADRFGHRAEAERLMQMSLKLRPAVAQAD